MQKLLTTCGALLSVLLIAGCVTTTPGLGDESGNAILPSGMTLLDSDEAECDGTVQVAEEMIEDEGEGLQGEFFVEAGENATFELEEEYESIEWACVGEDSQDTESTRCPREATHVRITRASSGDELIFECYG